MTVTAAMPPPDTVTGPRCIPPTPKRLPLMVPKAEAALILTAGPAVKEWELKDRTGTAELLRTDFLVMVTDMVGQRG